MRTLRVDPSHPDRSALERAAAVLRSGGLVAFPTETVYGLGANALDEGAVRRIFEAKGRPADNPLIVHVAGAAGARRLVTRWPPEAERAAAAFWPGPLTLVLPKAPAVPAVVTAALPTVAVRVPSHPVALGLLRAADLPVAAPSANPFTGVSPTTAAHVERTLGERIDLIVDGGPTTVGIESTVVDLSGERPVVLRPGMITAEALDPVIGPLAGRRTRPTRETAEETAETEEVTEAEVLEAALPAKEAKGPAEGARPSPGMLERHYAPEADVRLFEPDERERTTRLAREASGHGLRVGALLLDPLDAPIDDPIRMPRDTDAYARELYGALHALESTGCDLILIERVPPGPEWAGIRDRLERAAG